MAYPETGTFESAGPCPATHPVRVSQVMFEVIWDTSSFNNPEDWPADGSQPFVWSFGDGTGYANHADYVFGWKDDSLQKILDTKCYVNCPGAKLQSIEEMNKCSVKETVVEDIDGCEYIFRVRGCGSEGFANLYCRVGYVAWWPCCVVFLTVTGFIHSMSANIGKRSNGLLFGRKICRSCCFRFKRIML
jgi:hypothetical protein